MATATSQATVPKLTLKRLEAIRNQYVLSFEHQKEKLLDLTPISNDEDLELALVRKDALLKTKREYEQITATILENFDQGQPLLEFEEQFTVLLAKLNCVIKTYQTRIQQSINIQSNNERLPSPIRRLPKLPELPTPVFSGKDQEWMVFRDLFTSIVLNRQDITDLDKLQYLVQALPSGCKQLITHFPSVGTSLERAWEALQTRFENTRLLATANINSFMNPPNILESNPQTIRNFIDHARTHFNALQNMKLDVPLEELIALHILLQRLPTNYLRDWERQAPTTSNSTLEELFEFCERQYKVSIIQLAQLSPTQAKQENFSFPRNQGNALNSRKCTFCSEQHFLFTCKGFQSLSVDKRHEHVRKHKLCFNCFKPYSFQHKCSIVTCKSCGKRHHTLLHKDINFQQTAFTSIKSHNKESLSATNANSQQQTRNLRSTEFNTVRNSQIQAEVPKRYEVSESNNEDVMMQPQASNSHNQSHQITGCTITSEPRNVAIIPTATVLVHTSVRSIKATALIDSGSSCNFISSQLAETLQLPIKHIKTVIHTLGEGTTDSQRLTNVNIASCVNSWQKRDDFIILPKLTSNFPSKPIPTTQIMENLQLADANFCKPKCIDLILGAAFFAEILTTGKIHQESNSLIYQNTKLGWLVLGIFSSDEENENLNANLAISMQQVSDQIQGFWTVEELPKVSTLTIEEQQCENFFKETTKREINGRYVVALPLKKPQKPFGSTKSQAIAQLYNLERKFEKDKQLAKDYKLFMKEYLELQHMIPAAPTNKVTYHIPHHAVVRKEATTSKLRVVFNASASSNGVSLNDNLCIGATLQSSVFHILLRFRTHLIAFSSDVQMMFRQIKVHSEYYDLQRIFWRFDSTQPLKEYQLTTLTYGTASAPFLATRVLQQLAEDEASHCPQIKNIILNDTYVDNVLSGCDNLETAKQLYKGLCDVMSKGQMNLRKWQSNSPQLLNIIPYEMQEESLKLQQVSLCKHSTQTLGLTWIPSTDNLQVKFSTKACKLIENYTKRQMLSSIASIFDPLGILAPVVIKAKLIMQSLWKLDIKWDDLVPTDINSSFKELCNELRKADKISFTRCATPISSSESIELHGFCDASFQAYGACIYLKCQSSDMVSVKLLCAKTRVAPLRHRQIPHLELCAAVLLANLQQQVITAINRNVSRINLYTDSTVVCAWIKSPPQRRMQFVSTRIAEINELTTRSSWHHVSTKENPADLLTRGTSLQELQHSKLWWQGPDWLTTNNYKETVCLLIPRQDMIEEREQPTFKVTTDFKQRILKLIQENSQYLRIVRVVAWLFKSFSKTNLRTSKEKMIPTLTTQDIERAQLLLVHIVQQEAFTKEASLLSKGKEVNQNSSLSSLAPFLDRRGIIRVGGRLQNSSQPFDIKHQMILPNKHPFTHRLIRHLHTQLLHAGTQSVMALLRQNFWVTKTRLTVRSVIKGCVICRRHTAEAAVQQMGNIPSVRLEPSQIFAVTGLDYAGPFTLRLGTPRSKIFTKAYIVLFICMSTKAVYCDVVSNLTTVAFLAALDRFVSRRGKPCEIHSDNGTTFRGANKELVQIYKFLNNQAVQSHLQEGALAKGINWKFIPPRAPHFGGLWESSIKSFKQILTKTVGLRILTFEELSTLAAKIEAILNSRPLVPLTEDVQDLHYLSPAHFLIQRPLTAISAIPNESPIDHVTRWRRIQSFTEILWQEWTKHYITSLQKRNKWQATSPNLRIDQIVLLMDSDLPVTKWKLGRITELLPGKDGKVRVVRVKTQEGNYIRPINKLAPLIQQE